MSAGILTVDEVRANLGLAPMGGSAQRLTVQNASVKKNGSALRKDDENDEDDEVEEDDEDDEARGGESDEGDDEDDGNFNSKHPRWPAGRPGGVGGEFAPKDASIADPDGDKGSIYTDDIRSALIDGMNGPSRLPAGTQVAGDNVVPLIPLGGVQSEEAGGESGEEKKELEELKQEEQMIEIGIGAAMSAPAANNTPTSSAGNLGGGGQLINPDGTLLNADQAIISQNKIIGYSLNPDNKDGADKAIVFNSALGYNQYNADSLIQQLQQGVKEYPATPGLADNFGQRFSVDIPITGPNGNMVSVRSAWIYDSNSVTPRLISAYVLKK